MDIVRNDDGTRVVPEEPGRGHDAEAEGEDDGAEAAPTSRVLHPGEGGYDEALAAWDLQQNPDREPVVSTASGRQEGMAVVHAVAADPDHDVARAVGALDDPEAS